MRRFVFKLDNGTVLNIKPPTLRMYYKELRCASTDPQLFNAVADICGRNDEGIAVNEEYVIDNFTVDDLRRFVKELTSWIEGERASDPN
ncbi:MAG: hypothetical protein IKO47_08830 [Ruminococcus sp.]|nr:hypothetical protein [Ruminococcus sp.]